MKVYLLLKQASYDEAFTIISIFKNKIDADGMQAKLTNEGETYLKYWVKEEEMIE